MNDKNAILKQQILNVCISPDAYRQHAPALIEALIEKAEYDKNDEEILILYHFLRAEGQNPPAKSLLMRLIAALTVQNHPILISLFSSELIINLRKIHEKRSRSDTATHFLALLPNVLTALEILNKEKDAVEQTSTNKSDNSIFALRQNLRAERLIRGASVRRSDTFHDIKRKFSVVIKGKTYAPRMDNFYEVLSDFYIEKSETYLERRKEFSKSLTQLALRIDGFGG